MQGNLFHTFYDIRKKQKYFVIIATFLNYLCLTSLNTNNKGLF
jgi:hypothetical protein